MRPNQQSKALEARRQHRGLRRAPHAARAAACAPTDDGVWVSQRRPQPIGRRAVQAFRHHRLFAGRKDRAEQRERLRHHSLLPRRCQPCFQSHHRAGVATTHQPMVGATAQ